MKPLTITNARIFTADGTSDALVEGAVHIADGRVVRIADPDALQDLGEERVIDARGRVVIPGMIDAHCHAYGISLDENVLGRTPMTYKAHKAAQRVERALARGFTTIRDVAGGDAGLRRAIEEGLVRGPRYLYTGAALSQTGGHGDSRDEEHLDHLCCDVTTEVVDGADNVRAAVRERFRTGAHAIKLMTSGGVMSPTDPLRIPQYTPEEVRAATDEAARRGSYVAAHAYSPEAIVHSVRNGVRSIEHGNLLDAETAEVMAEGGAYLVPTLATYDAMDRRGEEVGLTPVGRAKNDLVLDAGRRAIAIATAGGVPVGFGTDLMGALEDEQLSGLAAQAEVQDMSTLLRSVTVVNAALLQRPDLGRIGEGAAGDVLILARDPFEDASALWDVAPDARVVISRGGVVAAEG